MNKIVTTGVTLAFAAISASAAIVEQWDMSGDGTWQNSNNGLNIGGHYNTNNHTLAQTAGDSTFLYAPSTLPQGFGGKTALSSAIDLTAGVVTLSMAFTDIDWSGTPGANANIGFRLWEHGAAGAEYIGVQFLDNGDRIRTRVESSAGNFSNFGRYGADLTASGTYNAVVEIDYDNNEVRLSGAWDWAPGGATTQTNSFDFAAAGFTSIGNFQTRYANWSSGDTMLVDDISIAQTIPEPATLGLIAAFGGSMMFIRRRFVI